ncbi:MAG: peptidylprolyl isomerase [Bacteroidales bacterium]|jgi:peptidyl-prolyl cis-trans isomerase SurA|nr:peptidylprolyl isomerase [Bacteroidales bacterium]MDD2687486.1 peptidylprolyl isomerase [Bacteroidales bacterium]MDD3331158.1 peptidylprolyl isomerase [Bacteroidales bacterium]MDD3691899.1 peptidylprolyl isomerase [Bacteroidales bacterium]MDD4044247.1 peptidylprolyl isomerase [Bacteroidales bacterium]
MKKIVVFSFLIIFVQSCLLAQNNKIVMKIGKENITLDEFVNTYQKNNDLKNTNEQDLREYIDLYINFRLKYAEAISLRLDTIGALLNELDGYRAQAARSYLTDKEVNQRLLDEAMERMKWDVRASHIMKKLPLEAKPQDTLKAYKEIMSLREQILKGASFADLAEKESDDPSARDRYNQEGKISQKGNKGDLGYFTVFDMIYSFESAVYAMKVGEISMPVRSEFGYHLIYLQDKKPALGRCAASQILIEYPKNATKEDSLKVKEKAQEAYVALQEGMDFAEAVQKYCTDKGLIERKGALPLFSASRFDGDFVQHLYGLETNEVSKPFETFYGMHIVKLTQRIPVEINDEIKSATKHRIMKDSRSHKSKEAFVERLKKEYNFKELKIKGKFPALEQFYTIDSSIFNGQWKAQAAASWNQPLFELDGKAYTQKDFAAYLEENQYEGVQNVNLDELVMFNYKQYVEQTVMDYEDAMLEKKYPEFAHLMKEYHEGVLLYELSERKVWKKAEIDTIGLKAFYQNVKNDYLYPVRVKVNTYTFADETAYNQWNKLLKKGKSPLEAQEKINKKTALVLQKLMLRWKGQEASFDSIFNWNDWKEVIKTTQSGRNTEISLDYKSEQIRNLYMHKPTLTFVEVKEFLAPSPRPLEEVKGVIVSLYQNYLEEEWIKTLRAENEVWVDYDKILSLIKE